MGAGDLERGVDVLISIGGVEVGGQRDCSFAGSQQLIEAGHKKSGGFEKYLMGNLSGKIDLDNVLVDSDAAQQAIMTAWFAKTTVTAAMAFSDGMVITGSAYVIDPKLNGPYKDVASMSMSLQYDGTFTYS
jgi:predicted secreted protein